MGKFGTYVCINIIHLYNLPMHGSQGALNFGMRRQAHSALACFAAVPHGFLYSPHMCKGVAERWHCELAVGALVLDFAHKPHVVGIPMVLEHKPIRPRGPVLPLPKSRMLSACCQRCPVGVLRRRFSFAWVAALAGILWSRSVPSKPETLPAVALATSACSRSSWSRPRPGGTTPGLFTFFFLVSADSYHPARWAPFGLAIPCYCFA